MRQGFHCEGFAALQHLADVFAQQKGYDGILNFFVDLLTNQQGREGSFHGGARQHDDGDHVAHEAEERDGRQEDARGHEFEHFEL